MGKAIGLMVRLPSDLRQEIVEFAAGSAARPRTSLNSAIVFLLRAGLAAVKRSEHREIEPGKFQPAQRAA